MNNATKLATLAPEAPPTRTAAIWVPDWPVIAAMRVADVSPHLPAVVMTPQHRVMAASAAARATGIRRGMRKRTAQAHCPNVRLLSVDEARDAAQFEPVAAAAEQVVPGLEVMRPGIALLPAAGAARYHGGEAELAEGLIEAVSEAGFECQIGVADGILAAVLAAREQEIIPAGGSPGYLAPRPVSDLLTVAVGPEFTAELTEVISLWERLGLKTLGALVELPSESMAGRFGQLGVWAQRLARGQDLRPPAAQRPLEDVAVEQRFDPPLCQVEATVVVSQQLASEFVELMLHRSLACGRVRISATSASGTRSRVWRTDDGAIGGMNAASIAQRMRWQLEGWLTDAALDGGGEEVGGILAIEILAEEVVPASTYQMSLWGGTSGADVRAKRALSNVQGILGLDQVQAVVLQGERTPWQQENRFTFGEPTPLLISDAAAPWPGALPTPSPTVVFRPPLPAQLLGHQGSTAIVELRNVALASPPTRLVIGTAPAAEVVNWAGPWLVPQDWWEGGPVALAFLQVVLASGSAYLLQYGPAGWEVRGEYE